VARIERNVRFGNPDQSIDCRLGRCTARREIVLQGRGADQ
jgi:hypothetical protein